jgi:hypothetical protein
MPNRVALVSSGGHRNTRTPPLNEVPAVVPIRPILLKARSSAAFIDSLMAYSIGLRLRLECRFRQPGMINHESFNDVVRSRSKGGPRLIFEFSDGSSDSRTGDSRRQSTQAIEGAGTDFSISMGYWIRPLSSNADLIVSFVWPDCGLDGQMLRVSHDILSQAVQNVEKLWDI